ncbi:hypothetical protein SMMN14_00351 [Sphaerulina musiva]
MLYFVTNTPAYAVSHGPIVSSQGKTHSVTDLPYGYKRSAQPNSSGAPVALIQVLSGNTVDSSGKHPPINSDRYPKYNDGVILQDFRKWRSMTDSTLDL